ncbi:nucleoside deaminase [Jeotgalibacillus haloalkalitolerans]|uniref:Nucleoside deaminase n=1 Tax=Jeotgalibacillus haloalkalitolerans TaxID=3104292 RepID=A0ABU5KHZ7_9BACL|nr:nucleoside deaminase [Jeotgalibacillus sp. HH7-29]MDZ5710800.1 nucleoside deaminase [Jeotgalibacillus sp. HH7-29]
MNAFMKRAIELAADNVREGGHPFGAVIMKDDEIVAEGVNELHLHFDVSGHAEMLAIRRLQEKIQSHDLSGYTMYASGEPCPMCYTTMAFAGMTDIYYCASVEEAAEAGLEKSADIYADLQKPREARSLQMKKVELEAGLENPMKLYKESQ